jgi:hypothetical protein
MYDILFCYDIICNSIKPSHFYSFLRYFHRFLPMISYTYHMKIALISVTYDIRDDSASAIVENSH